MNIISNCPLCKDKALHVLGKNETETQQCISCGYVTSNRYKLEKNQIADDNKSFNELTPQMKEWSVTLVNHIWIPTMMTLPHGMLYPENDDKDVMIWNFAPMVDIPKEEQEKYPIDGSDDKFYTQRYDTDNKKTFTWFAEALKHIQDLVVEHVHNPANGAPKLNNNPSWGVSKMG